MGLLARSNHRRRRPQNRVHRNRWIKVSEALDPFRFAVVAGRDPKRGAASGKIIETSPTSIFDLYWALRDRCKPVSRFDLVAFEPGDLWSAELIYLGGARSTTRHLAVPRTCRRHLRQHRPYGPITRHAAAWAAVPAVFAEIRVQLVSGAIVAQQNVANASHAIITPDGARKTW
ncbi:hypothetical protein B0T24DRAFT_596681 [Lasiosphaeria ovina]|uniref:Uncharacterized protein n=1 Tax=Lasiosphaeria ovina TaxID=92902 RepID=A0AAE0K005_9PEZI|nr:hypothetical protein B0T24DRAFT_596681 [Lasiosphaeria ovina]